MSEIAEAYAELSRLCRLQDWLYERWAPLSTWGPNRRALWAYIAERKWQLIWWLNPLEL